MYIAQQRIKPMISVTQSGKVLLNHVLCIGILCALRNIFIGCVIINIVRETL